MSYQTVNATDPYLKRMRELSTRVSLSFYLNSVEDNSEGMVNREGWRYGDDGVSCTAADWMFANRNQMISYGQTAGKYVTLDGTGCRLGDGYTLASEVAATVTGLWSDSVYRTAGNGVPDDGWYRVRKNVGYWDRCDNPCFTLYYEQPRELGQVYVTGYRPYTQYPIKYCVWVYPVSGEHTLRTDGGSGGTAGGLPADGGVVEHRVVGEWNAQKGAYGFAVDLSADERYTAATDEQKAAYVEQQIIFQETVNGMPVDTKLTFERMELEILRWSKDDCMAKIMYFSRAKNMLLTASDIKSLEILEEKSSAVDTLNFGITSNACTLYARDSGEQFTGNPDLLRKNKLIRPSVSVREANGKFGAYEPLGVFYSDSWEMEAKSNFVKVKGYDALYALQQLAVSFPLQQTPTGAYAVRRNVSVYDALTELQDQINELRRVKGIYGNEAVFEIDPATKAMVIPYLLLKEQSAWDALQQIAYFALLHVYCDRAGKIVITAGIGRPTQTQTALTEINRFNSFTYTLPMQNKMVINQVKLPYYVLAAGKQEDNTIEVKPDKMQTTVENGQTTARFSVQLKNFYPVIEKVTLLKYLKVDGEEKERKEEIASVDTVISYFYDHLDITLKNFVITDDLSKVAIEIGNATENFDSFFALESTTLYSEPEKKTSLNANGPCEYTHDSCTLMVGKATAETVAWQILQQYNDGVLYFETEWIGSPHIQPGDSLLFDASKKEVDGSGGNPILYECFSNEFTLSGGLRAKSKLRQKEKA